MAESGPNSEVVPAAAWEIGADSWEVGFVPWLGSFGGVRARARLRGALRRGPGVGSGVGVATTSVVREEAVIRAGARGFGSAFAAGRGAGGSVGLGRGSSFGVCDDARSRRRGRPRRRR